MVGRQLAWALVVLVGSGLGTSRPSAAADVVAFKNDFQRTGQNLVETTLTPANVNAASFGKIRMLATDGKVDAQPLYLSALDIAGKQHNVVFAATERDSVYAFDADSGATLWKVSLLGPGETPSGPHGCGQVYPVIGITATPAIGRWAGPHGAMWVVAMSNHGADIQRLHILDVTTGRELYGGPREITATYTAPDGTKRTFDPGQYEERAALLLSRGTLYTTWTSHCDHAPYSGWIISYDATTLKQNGVLNVGPNGSGSGAAGIGPGIWMSGSGPAVDDAGFLYLLTGNGPFETELDAQGFPRLGDYGNSFLKLNSLVTSGRLSVADYFTYSDAPSDSAADLDLGSGGIIVLPDLKDSGGTVRHLAVGAGKNGHLYVVNRDAMGKFTSGANHIWQELPDVLTGGVFSTPAWFNGTLYYGPSDARLLAFTVTDARLSAAPTSQSATEFPYPGVSPAVSANGLRDGIVWAHENSSPAVLHAYEAGNLAHELYNSSQAGARDELGAGNKFITPMIADGKVFIGTQSGVAVFGLLH
jgi:outer membrane protein assembly factor BamB